MTDEKRVKHLRQILLWPVYLLPLDENAPIQDHWEHLATPSPDNPWREIDDEFGDPGEFQVAPLQRVRDVPAAGPALPLRPGSGPGRAQGLRREPDQDHAPQRRRARARHARQGRRADHARDRPRRSLFLLRHRHRHPGRRGRHQRSRLRARAGAAVPLRPRLSCLLGRRTAAAAIARGRSNGCRRSTTSWPCPTTRTARSICRSSAGTARPASPRIGSICSPARALPQRQEGRDPLPAARILPHALHDAASPSRMWRSCRAPTASAWRSATSRAAEQSLPYSETYLHDFEQRYLLRPLFQHGGGRRPEPARAFSPPAIRWSSSATPSDSFFMNPEGGMLGRFRHQHFLMFLIAHFQKATLQDVLRSPRRGREPARHHERQGQPHLPPRHSPRARELPALRAPLLVPRDLEPGADARAVRQDAAATCSSTPSIPRCARSCRTWATSSTSRPRADRTRPSCGSRS